LEKDARKRSWVKKKNEKRIKRRVRQLGNATMKTWKKRALFAGSAAVTFHRGHAFPGKSWGQGEEGTRRPSSKISWESCPKPPVRNDHAACYGEKENKRGASKATNISTTQTAIGIRGANGDAKKNKKSCYITGINDEVKMIQTHVLKKSKRKGKNLCKQKGLVAEKGQKS